MAAKTEALNALLNDVEIVLEVVEDGELNAVPPDDPLMQEARDLGIPLTEKMTFGELQSAIKAAKASSK